MSNKKQTAVEWLVDQLESFGNKHELQVSWDTVDDLLEQAKAMHKQEIVRTSKDSYIAGYFNKQSKVGDLKNFAEEYYNETFNT
jgi:hypothetical protein